MAANTAPYKIKKRGQNFAVVNNANEVKGTHPSKSAAVSHMRALYAAVPGGKGGGKAGGKAAGRMPMMGKRPMKAADDENTEMDPAYDPGVLAAAIDALIDTVLDMLEDCDESTLTPELMQIRDLLYAGEPVADRLLKLLGVVDPDDVPESMFSQVPQAQGAASKPYGDVPYGDPGYQKDKTKRYPIDTADHVRSAWSYINQAANAAKYTPGQRENIKARIAAAAKRFGVDLNREDAAVRSRLTKNYGPRDSAPAVLGPPPNSNGMTPQQVEAQVIAQNSKTPEAQGPHPFMEAEFPNDNGDPRCRLCGQDDNAHKQFTPELPVAASEMTVPSPEEAARRLLTVHENVPNLSEGQALAPPDETVKAFLTEVNGKVLLTAPANVFTREVEKARDGNKHMLWMQGRFVGAEKANRNGAFWTTKDLELGQVSVANGPLNWLHEARHVIGTVARAQLVTREEAADAELSQPYIEAASAIWRWIYPDEAWVVEQASDAHKLWYSMECISERVSCVGEGSCGADVSYADYIQAANGTCAHMTERSAARRFADPTFLGGAVIVPPVRPGWAEADAHVLRQASSLAEQAFDQAGQPDVPASEWEQLMAQVIRYAEAADR